LAIIVPLAAFHAEENYTLTHESRKAPVISTVTDQKTLTDYLQDRLGFRPALVRVYSVLRYYGVNNPALTEHWFDKQLPRAGKIVHQNQVGEDSGVFVAHNGWLFNFANLALGGFSFTRKNIENNIKAEQRTRDYYAAKGAVYFAMIVPHKANIYPEFLDAKLDPATRETPADKMLAALEDNGVHTINPKQTLLANKDQQIWQVYDTHWTQRATYLAYQDILKIFNQTGVLQNEQPVSVTFTQNLTKDCNLSGYLDLSLQETIPIAQFERSSVETTEGALYDALRVVFAEDQKLPPHRINESLFNEMHLFENPTAQGGTLMLWTDSMGIVGRGLPGFLAEHFKRVLVIDRRPPIDPKIDDILQPDVVIYSNVESSVAEQSLLKASWLP
jgi:hypothetical protein